MAVRSYLLMSCRCPEREVVADALAFIPRKPLLLIARVKPADVVVEPVLRVSQSLLVSHDGLWIEIEQGLHVVLDILMMSVL